MLNDVGGFLKTVGVWGKRCQHPQLEGAPNVHWASKVVLVVKNLADNAGDKRDEGLIPGLGRSPEVGMATHSSILAWRIPWTEEPGGL